MKKLGRWGISLALVLLLTILLTTPALAARTSTNYSLNGSEADNIVAVAVAQSKVTPKLTGSDFGFRGSWCGYFISWCAKEAGVSCVPDTISGGRSSIAHIVENNLGEFYCYTDALVHSNDSYKNWSIYKYLSSHPEHKLNSTGRNHMHEVSRGDFKPLKGDIVVFLSKNDHTHPQFSHVGLVREDYSGKGPLLTVEGNTTGKYTVACQERSIAKSSYMQIIGYVRPNYNTTNSGSPEKPESNVTLTLSKNSFELHQGEQATLNFSFTGDIGYPEVQPDGSGALTDISGSWNADKRSGWATFTAATAGTGSISINLFDKNGNLLISKAASIIVKESETTPAKKATTLTFSPSSIFLNLSKKQSQEIELTIGGDYSQANHLRYSLSNPDVVSIDWSSYESGVVIRPVITGKTTGETTLTCSVINKGTGEIFATAALKIIVNASTYTVRYDANGGKNAPASQTKTAQQKLTLTSDCPKREGFTFAGWATSRNGSVQYQPGDLFTADKDVTLYAIWEAKNQVSLTLANDSFTVKPGEQATLRFTFTGDIGYPEAQLDESGVLKDAIGSWNADKCSGSVTFTAVKAGTGSVTINLRDKNNNLLISKTASIIVKEVAISEPSIQVAATQMNLVAGTGNARSNYAITNPQGWPVKWYSSDTSIVTVDANGSSTTVTPVRAGTATITASMSFDGITYESSCTVTVTQANVELSETSLEMVAGEAVSLYVLGNQNVTWSSTNPSVATVDRNGVVTALQSGYATIKAQLKDDPSMRALCYVTVTESDTDEGSISLSWYRNELSIDIGRVSGASLHANIYPAGQTITWMSSDPNVATVESYDDDSANVCAKSVGTAIITASFTYKGKTYSANSIVTVTSSFAPGPDDDRVFFGVGG